MDNSPNGLVSRLFMRFFRIPTHGFVLAKKSTIRFPEPLRNAEAESLLRSHNFRNSYIFEPSCYPQAFVSRLPTIFQVTKSFTKTCTCFSVTQEILYSNYPQKTVFVRVYQQKRVSLRNRSRENNQGLKLPIYEIKFFQKCDIFVGTW